MHLFYTKEHEWIDLEDTEAKVGITNYAVQQLGDITFVELPTVGEELKQGDVFCTIESVKAASDVYAPMSGDLIEVNEELEDTPELINESPEEDGWIAKIYIVDKTEKENLMTAEEYEKYIEEID